MTEYTANIDRDQAIALLRDAKRVIVTTHGKPDGDAFGSVVALTSALRDNGAQVHAYFIPPVLPWADTLAGGDLVEKFDENTTLPEADLVILVDTGAWSQVAPMRELLEPRLEQMLIIDHHISGDVPAKWRYIDGDAAATCEILAELIGELRGDYCRVIGEALFVGIASDTGWFRFSNTKPHTMQIAARLLAQGVDSADLYGKIEQNERAEKLKLMIRVLDSLELLADERAAVMVLRANDFAETGANVEDTERFVDVPQVVGSVQLVALINQPPGDGPVGMSFRSKPGPEAVNVAHLAQRFGGGGHARAAGAKILADLDQVIRDVKSAIVEAMGD